MIILLITLLTVAIILNRFGKSIHLAEELHGGQARCRKVAYGGEADARLGRDVSQHGREGGHPNNTNQDSLLPN